MEIKILGPGCVNCQKVERLVREAVAETGIAADIEAGVSLFSAGLDR